LPEFGHSQTELAQHPQVEVAPNQPDPHMLPSGAANAAPAQQPALAPSTPTAPTTDGGPGAAGAATLPEGAIAGPDSPDKSSLVSSSLMTSLQDFLSHKK
jgi:hypothetical protein